MAYARNAEYRSVPVPVRLLDKTNEPSNYDEEIRSVGREDFPLLRKPSHLLRHRLEVKAILRKEGPYDVSAHPRPVFRSWVVLKRAQRATIPVRIVHSHADWTNYLPNNFLKRRYFLHAIRLSRQYASHGLACSDVAGKTYFGEEWQKVPRWRFFIAAKIFLDFGRSRIGVLCVRSLGSLKML